MRTRTTWTTMLLLGLLLSGALSISSARAARGLGTSGFAYDGYTSKWHKHEGIPDGTATNQALHLEKVDPLAEGHPEGLAGAGVSFLPVSGITLNELGFDLRNDGVCGVFPRYLVRDTAGNEYFFTCQSGIPTSAPADPAGWTRIRHNTTPAESRFPGQPPFIWGVTQISYIGLGVQFPDGSTGVVHLDNLDVNGTLIGKSGGAGR